MFDERRTQIMPGYTGHTQEQLETEPSRGYKEVRSQIPGKLFIFLISYFKN